jgi:hypothetical protein
MLTPERNVRNVHAANMRTPSTTRNNYLGMRALLVRSGLSLSRWAQAHGYPASTVYDAARGRRRGPVAREIVRKLEEQIGRKDHIV